MHQIIGIMTGNSMDAIDVVLTSFDNNKMEDIAYYTTPFSDDMRSKMQYLRDVVINQEISMKKLDEMPEFHQIHDEYIQQVADSVNAMLQENKIDKKDITAIGFHGKTLDHFPPSSAKLAGKKAYTLQIGSGKMLSSLTGIRVISDFRSDDVMNGGEGAPLAPTHNIHQAQSLGLENVIFFNAGNTSNIAIINGDRVFGWDAGPFNDFTDKLVRLHTNDVADVDGKYGKNGKVDMDLVRKLFEKAVVTGDNSNYLELAPPKSADPRFYKFDDVIEFTNPTNLADSIRTAEYFSAYVAVHTLKFVPEDMIMPNKFLLFGGGWSNPLSLSDFKAILNQTKEVLPEHKQVFEKIRERFKNQPLSFAKAPDDKYTEARIFADLAHSYLNQTPWTNPQTTGCKSPTILGLDSATNPKDDKISRAAKDMVKISLKLRTNTLLLPNKAR